jgi:hypothetical protein
MQLKDYVEWVANEIFREKPYQQIKTWIRKWERTLRAIQGAQGIFELYSLVCARWEFLGSLYLGTTGKTSVREAVEYISNFLMPINHDYTNIYSIRSGHHRSDFFSIFRNNPLHSYTPAGIADSSRINIIGWCIGAIEDPDIQKYHLQIHNTKLFVDGEKFVSEFLQSLHLFSEYFRLNSDIKDGLTPSYRWLKGFWWRFIPLNLQKDEWEHEGYCRGIPK